MSMFIPDSGFDVMLVMVDGTIVTEISISCPNPSYYLSRSVVGLTAVVDGKISVVGRKNGVDTEIDYFIVSRIGGDFVELIDPNFSEIAE